MKVRLQGINKVTTRLASGELKTYYYAWKGGPRLPGLPGSDEFIAAYQEAVARKPIRGAGTIQSILTQYQDTPKWADLADRTRRDYVKHVMLIEREFGDFPLSALSDRRTRAEFLGWRDRMGLRSRRQADYVFATFASVLAWAYDRGLIDANPAERPGKLYRADRADRVWTAADETLLQESAPAHLWLAYMLAVWTGQRQGDLLRLTWTAYTGNHIRLRQRKTGRRVLIPVAAPLRQVLDTTPRAAVTILTTTRATAWTSSGFSASWRKAVIAAGVVDLTFHDLRGTAVTRLALAGCSQAEIATITGHSLDDVGVILDAHYLSRDSRLAESAIQKLEVHEAGTKAPK